MFQGHGLWAHLYATPWGQIYSFAGYGSFYDFWYVLFFFFQNSKIKQPSWTDIKKKMNISFPENDKYFKHY